MRTVVLGAAAFAALMMVQTSGQAAEMGKGGPTYVDSQKVLDQFGKTALLVPGDGAYEVQTNRRVKDNIAMTGEITLRGRVLPVGGIKEKVLAAHRAGLDTIILPIRNERDLDDLPEEIRKELTFILAERVEDVWKAALEDAKTVPVELNGHGNHEPEVQVTKSLN